MISTGKVLIIIGLSLMIIGSIARLIADSIEPEEPLEYDYLMELESDSIHGDVIKISSDGESWYVIHPDSLEEFIIKDNL